MRRDGEAVIDPPSILPPVLNVVLLTQNIGAADPFDVPKDQPVDKTVVPDKIRDLWKRWAASCANMLAEEEQKMGGEPVDVFVLHVQEIGGKGFSAPMIDFLNDTHRLCYPTCGWSSGLLMARDNDVKTFTALGSFIFLSHRAAAVASILDFRERAYRRIADVDGILRGGEAMLLDETNHNDSGNSNAAAAAAAAAALSTSTSVTSCGSTSAAATLMRNICYPAKFVNADTSRKGFVLTSLRVGQRVFNFINMHLFHDADNATAASVSPSPYVARRIEAFLEALTETNCVVDETDPLFLFGDFNIRLDTFELAEALRAQGHEVKLDKKKVGGDPAVWETVTSPAKWQWMKSFDKEPPTLFARAEAEFGQRMYEAPVCFGPTYLVNENKTRSLTDADVIAAAPFHRGFNQIAGDDEDEYRTRPHHAASHRAVYQAHRFPAWCDRIFFNQAAQDLLVESARPSSPSRKRTLEPLYGSAPLVHMDHLSVFLRAHFKMV